jgi:hypothetical protein
LESGEAAKAAAVLVEEMIKVKKLRRESYLLTSSLAALAPRLESRDVAKISAVLAKELSKAAKAKDHDELALLLVGLNALAPHMAPKEAARLYSPAAYSHLVSGSSQLIRGLSAAAIRMNDQDASITLLQAMEKATHPSELEGFAEALSVVAARMEPKEAARVCSRAAAMLTKAWENEHKRAPWLPAKGIAAVAPYLEDKEARQLYSQAIASVLQADEAFAGHLRALAAHMDPEQAAQAAAILNRALARLWGSMIRREMRAHGDSTSLVLRVGELEDLAEPLSAVAGRLEPKEAARACAQAGEILIEALAKTYHFHGPRLGMVLSRVAARLEPEEAARVCSRAAAIITEPSWVFCHALPALAARMEPREAARVCSQAAANQFKAMAMAKPEGVDPDFWTKGLTEGLSAVLARSEPAEQTRRSSAVVAAIGLLADTDRPLAAPVVLRTVREPWPGRLSPQELVELLKHPTCLGPARRIVLDQLESHYKHAFADHWAFVRYAQEQKLGLDLSTPPTLRVSSAGGEKN